MAFDPSRLDPEQLLAQSAWVRSLALGLLRDAATADDIVQDTWVAALERPPRPQKLRAWLAAVVFNSVRLHIRSRVRRNEREQIASQSERLPSTDAIVLQEAERKRVVQIVLQLAEPHRSTLLLRYWSDLTPQEIARHLDVPASTVRNRLARALELVRERLDAEPGGGEGILRALLALPPGAPAMPVTAAAVAGSSTTATELGALVMSAKLKLGVGLVILATAGGLTWVLTSPRDDATRDVVASDSPLEQHAVPETTTSPVEVARQPDRPAAAREVLTVTRPTSVLVLGNVTNASGETIAATLRFSKDGEEDRDARADAHGFALPGLAPGEWGVTCRAPGHRDLSKTVQLTQERERVDLVLEPVLQLGIHFVTAEGLALGEQLAKPKAKMFGRLLAGALGAIATREEPASIIPELTWDVNGVGVGKYKSSRETTNVPPGCDGLLEIDAQLPVYASAVLGNAVLATELVEAPATEVTLRVAIDEAERRAASLVMRVVARDTRQRVPELEGGLGSSVSVTTGKLPQSADGTVMLESLPPGMLAFFLHAPGLAAVTRHVRLVAGETLDLGLIEMEREVTIEGRVIAASGTQRGSASPLHPSLLLRTLDSLRPDEPLRVPYQWYEVEASGKFSVGVSPGRQLLIASAQDLGPTAVMVDTTAGPVRNIEIPLHDASRVVVKQRLSRGDGVRITDAHGLPLWFTRVLDASPLKTRLSPGRYRLEVYRDQVLVTSRSFDVADEAVTLELGP